MVALLKTVSWSVWEPSFSTVQLSGRAQWSAAPTAIDHEQATGVPNEPIPESLAQEIRVAGVSLLPHYDGGKSQAGIIAAAVLISMAMSAMRQPPAKKEAERRDLAREFEEANNEYLLRKAGHERLAGSGSGDILNLTAPITGKVIEVLVAKNRVRIEGVAMVKRHLKPGRDPKVPNGGIIEKFGTIHISNVMPIDPSTNKPTRVGIKTLEDGRKVRVAKGSGELIAEAVLALEFSASTEDLQRTIHAHPSLAEAVHEAALNVDKRALNYMN